MNDDIHTNLGHHAQFDMKTQDKDIETRLGDNFNYFFMFTPIFFQGVATINW